MDTSGVFICSVHLWSCAYARNMAQTDYSLDYAPAVAGMLADDRPHVIESRYVAEEEIPPGRFVEINGATGKLRLVQGTGTAIARCLGVSMLQRAREANAFNVAGNAAAYKIDENVMVVRQGRVWVETVTPFAFVDLDAANISHSSTVATHRGKVTSAATSGTAGSEIGDVGAKARRLNSDSSLCEVEINAP